MAQTKPKAGQFFGVSGNGTDGQFLRTDGAGGMSWAAPITNPTLASIDYPGTATAADPAGGESIIINGTGFASGITCTVGGTSATTAFNSSSQITITSPAKTAGQYTVAVANLDGGTADSSNFIQYSGVPVWSTASGSLGSVEEGASASFQVTATEGSDTIEYAVTSGSLPSGLSLAAATGAITGTAGNVSSDTTSTFSITATDDENQTSSARSFSITITTILPSGQFNAVVYTGTSAVQSITGMGFKPDLLWIRDYSQSEAHFWQDSLRGSTWTIYSSSNANQFDETQAVTSFDADGFTLGTYTGTNDNGYATIAYGWKAGGAPTATNSAGAGNVPTLGSIMIDGTASTSALAGTIPATKLSANTNSGFSVVTYTGTGSAGSYAHGLGGAPTCILTKKLDGTPRNWAVYHEGLTSATYELYLNTTGSEYNSNGAMYASAPSSTEVSIGTDDYINGSGSKYVAYNFKTTAGFTKTGSYTGTGAAGNYQETGFEPIMVIFKASSNTTNWYLVDNKRSGGTGGANPLTTYLMPNSTSGEQTGSDGVMFLDNGFSFEGSSFNNSGYSWVYIAIAADGSTTTPTLANSFDAELFDPTTSSSALPVTGMGFKPDFVWAKYRDGAQSNYLVDSQRGLFSLMYSDRNDAAYTASSYVQSFDTDGITYVNNLFNRTGADACVAWGWKGGGRGAINTDGTNACIVSANAAAGFSIVKLNKDNTNTETFGHGLGVVPELIILKRTASADDWYVYHKDLGNSTRISLNSDAAKVTGTGVWGSTTPTSSVFTLQNQSGGAHIAYCFASITNYSSIGTYTASGSAGSPTITTGFEPGFVIIKNADRSQEWITIDSTRGLNKSLQPNSNSAESVNGNIITTNATSFTIDVSGGGINYASGETMIYIAIKQN